MIADIMTVSSDPFIIELRKLCMNDKVMNQLIANTISWADVPSDDDILELEGWRSYQAIKQRAKTAYHHTVRSQKRAQSQRYTVKHPSQPPPMGRKPYSVMKQELTKHIIVQGRVSPIKEVVDVVYQEPAVYEEPDIIEPPISFTTKISTETFVKISDTLPVEASVIVPIKEPIIESIIEPTIATPPVKRPSKGKFNKRHKSAPSLLEYRPPIKKVYVVPYIPYILLTFLIMMLCSMKL